MMYSKKDRVSQGNGSVMQTSKGYGDVARSRIKKRRAEGKTFYTTRKKR